MGTREKLRSYVQLSSYRRRLLTIFELMAVILVCLCACTTASEIEQPAEKAAAKNPELTANDVHAVTTSRYQNGRNVFMDYCSFCHDVSEDNAPSGAIGLVRRVTDTQLSNIEIEQILQSPPAGMPRIPLNDQKLQDLIIFLSNVPKQKLYIQLDHP